jgi:hypothetical protein
MPKVDYTDQALKAAEQGKSGGTLKDSRQVIGSEPVKRLIPKILEGYLMPKPEQPKSNAPAGMGNAVKGDLGAYRQVEAKKVFKKLPGKDISNPLSYRKPAIEGGQGPHAV